MSDLKQTDLSKRLREWATSELIPAQYAEMFEKASDEIERYYAGMLNWKATAEAQSTQPEATAPAQDLSAAILNLQPEVPNLMTPNRAYRDGFIACRTIAAALASSANALSAGDRVDAAFSLADSMSISLEEPVQDALADFAKHQSAMAAARLVQSVAAILQSQKAK